MSATKTKRFYPWIRYQGVLAHRLAKHVKELDLREIQETSYQALGMGLRFGELTTMRIK